MQMSTTQQHGSLVLVMVLLIIIWALPYLLHYYYILYRWELVRLDWLHISLLQLLVTSLVWSVHSTRQVHSLLAVERRASAAKQSVQLPKANIIVSPTAGLIDGAPHPLLGELPGMIAQFTETLRLSTDAQTPWPLLISTSTEKIPRLTVHQSPKSAYAFKIDADLPVAPGTLFDLLCDYERRPEWDRLLVECRVCAQLDRSTIVLYVRLKHVWPTAQRDLLLLSHTCQLGEIGGGGEDGKGQMGCGLLNITKSIEFPAVPEYTDEGIIRMHTPLAGQLIQPHPQDSKRSRLLQLADADPKGWIPQSLVQVIMTQSLPRSVVRMTDYAQTLTQRRDSAIMSRISDDSRSAILCEYYPGDGDKTRHAKKDPRPNNPHTKNQVAQVAFWSTVAILTFATVRIILTRK